MADTYRVWRDDEKPDDGPDFEISFGDASDAAEKWAQWAWWNNGGWEWLRSGQVVYVRSSAGRVTRHEITVDAEPVFSAFEANEPKPAPLAPTKDKP